MMLWQPGQGIKPDPSLAELDREHPIAASLRALWLFNEGAGTRAADAVAGRGAGFVGTPSWGTSPIGPCLGLDGLTQYGTVAYSPALSFVGSPISIWVRVVTGPNPGPNGQIVVAKPFASTHTDPYLDWGMFWTPPGSGQVINFRIGSTTLNAATGLATNTAYDIGLSADGTNFRWYVNGRLDSTQATASLPTNTNSQGVRFGANASAGEQFGGKYVAAGLWARALSPAEFRSLSADPYAMFRPRGVTTYSAPTATSRLLNLRRRCVA